MDVAIIAQEQAAKYTACKVVCPSLVSLDSSGTISAPGATPEELAAAAAVLSRWDSSAEAVLVRTKAAMVAQAKALISQMLPQKAILEAIMQELLDQMTKPVPDDFATVKANALNRVVL